MSKSHLAEAEEAYAKAKSNTKKRGFGLIAPDWVQAARWYREACKHYVLVEGQEQQAIQVLRESAVVHQETSDWFQAAKDQEAAANLLVKTGDGKKAAEVYQAASIDFRKYGSVDKSVLMQVKAAECLDSIDKLEGLLCFERAFDVYDEEKKWTSSEATYHKAISYALKAKKTKTAIQYLERQCEVYKMNLNTFETDLYRNFLCIIILNFHLDDIDTAISKYHEFEGVERFSSNECGAAAMALVQAYEDADPDALEAALKRSPFKFILNSVAQIARKLKFDASLKPRNKIKAFVVDDDDDFKGKEKSGGRKGKVAKEKKKEESGEDEEENEEEEEKPKKKSSKKGTPKKDTKKKQESDEEEEGEEGDKEEDEEEESPKPKAKSTGKAKAAADPLDFT